MTQESTESGAFRAVPAKVDFVAIEKRLLDWWRDEGIVERYLKRNENAEKRYSFIDGPITANNPMGVHHAWGRTYKDLFLRWRTMQGYKQRYQNGFDGQGLWVEVEVEKDLGFGSKRDIEAYGIGRFVEDCKERVNTFAGVQTEQSKRLGYWMDWDDSYFTTSDENNYTIWHFLKVCHERGWLYEGTDVMPWCPRCGTGLSQHEIVTEGYREIVHPGLFLKFPLTERPGESLLVWTTTPWTLTANVVAAVHPELTYVKVSNRDEVLYLVKARVDVLEGEYEVLEEMPGTDLAGWRYQGPFDELPAQEGIEHRVVEWDEVGEDEGTGIVHVAPGAGAEDFALGRENDLQVIAPLDEDGSFVRGFGWLEGMNVGDVNEPIFDSLKEKGIFYKVEQYRHRYPVCWRCDTELVFRLVDEWYISMDVLRDRMITATKRIQWVPAFGLERELDWLRNMHDWMISKKRYWGLALPIYKCSCGNVDVVGSEKELEQRAVEGWERFDGHSPHRPWVDEVKIACSKCGEPVSRIKDVGNPWLDAGIVPFSTLGYRHESQLWKDWFPAHWISESFPGQFRNWFYSLLAMSAALENTEPFKAVFTYALVRDEHGEEMHKSRGNAIPFDEAADKMGVDVMRWMYLRQTPAANLNFGYRTGDEVRRRFLIPLWNVYSFFVTYANLDGWAPDLRGESATSHSQLDVWLRTELCQLVERVTGYFETWRPMEAMHAIEEFIDGLSNWYVRRSRRRFWKSENDSDKQAAYTTLYQTLTTLCRVLAPVTPFLAEEMYQNLEARVNPEAPPSVHLTDWPEPDREETDTALLEATRLAMRLASLGRSARASAKLKVRQPLSELVVEVRTEEEKAILASIEPQLLDELNVKRVRDAGEIGGLVGYLLKPNLPVLGPKYGPALPRVREALERADAGVVAAAVEAGEAVRVDGFQLDANEVLVERVAPDGYSVASEAGYAAGVSLDVTPELRAEGVAREIVHMIQNLRRSAGFEIADRITAYVEAGAEIQEALKAHEEYLRQEVLAEDVVFGAPSPGAASEERSVNGESVVLGVEKRG